MYCTYLERHNPDKNKYRFYQKYVSPSIFGDWSLVREWGRVGSPGTVRKEWIDSEEKSVIARQTLCDTKRKKGYQTKKTMSGKLGFLGNGLNL